MSRTTRVFIDEIIWHSAPRQIGAYQWRAVTYTLPARYGAGLKASAYQFRRISQFGSAPEQWTDIRDFPGYARFRPHNGLPEALSVQLRSLWTETGDLIADDMDDASLTRNVSQAPQYFVRSGPEGQLGFAF